jgi:mono/diheme cytochrome c family protein
MLFIALGTMAALWIGDRVYGGGRAPVQQQSATRNEPSAVDGKAMFDTYCIACHGREAKGDGPAGKALKKAPADLTRISARNGGTFPTERIRRFISGREVVAGHGTRDMPIWGGLFTDMDRDSQMATIRIANITEYLRSIQK